jgi:hypothetical protein
LRECSLGALLEFARLFNLHKQVPGEWEPRSTLGLTSYSCFLCHGRVGSVEDSVVRTSRVRRTFLNERSVLR